MEFFILRIVALALVTVLNLTIIISRKDDVGVLPIVIAVLLELISLAIVFTPEILNSVNNLITNL